MPVLDASVWLEFQMVQLITSIGSSRVPLSRGVTGFEGAGRCRNHFLCEPRITVGAQPVLIFLTTRERWRRKSRISHRQAARLVRVSEEAAAFRPGAMAAQ